jgi:hypothetical protein
MEEKTRQAVHSLLKTFAQKSLKDYDIETLKRAYPFHQLFFDEVGLVAFKQERSVVTKMGQSLYPELAKLIASETHSDVEREKLIQGQLSETTVSTIDRIVRDLRARHRSPDHAQEMREIRKTKATSVKVPVRVIADLYIGDHRDGPFFAEVKTPLPNLDICAETKSKILTFETLLRGKHARGYLAFAYNPFITRAAYAHGFTKQIMDMSVEVLMAEEFWDKIGGSGTFSELLSIVDSVGNEIREEKSMASGRE